jgi:hypothetical protein
MEGQIINGKIVWLYYAQNRISRNFCVIKLGFDSMAPFKKRRSGMSKILLNAASPKLECLN